MKFDFNVKLGIDIMLFECILYIIIFVFLCYDKVVNFN